MAQASVIVVGNEKGGAGKSTIAIHTATALLHADTRVAVLDLDLRQQTTGHFFANRRAWLAANGATAPMPTEDRLGAGLDSFDPTLRAALGKSRAKVLYQLEKLRKKTEREALHRDALASEEARYLSALLYPHRHPQERFYSILPFLAQHGMDLVDRLYKVVQTDCPDHRVVTL